MKKTLLVAGIAAAVLAILQTTAFSQENLTFAPYDCREYAELHGPAVVDIAEIFIDSTLIIPDDVLIAESNVPFWQEWSVVENYSFGMNRGTLTMIADLDALHPYFRDKIRELISRCAKQGIELAIVETFRTHAKQNEYKTMGKKYTNSTGGRSKHQYGLAVDVVPVVKGQPVWNNALLWKKVGTTGEKLGLRWGGRWRKPYDPAHFEWTGGLTSVHLAAGMLPKVPEDKYPCVMEDVEVLRNAWQEWEVFQQQLVSRKHESIEHSH